MVATIVATVAGNDRLVLLYDKQEKATTTATTNDDDRVIVILFNQKIHKMHASDL